MSPSDHNSCTPHASAATITASSASACACASPNTPTTTTRTLDRDARAQQSLKVRDDPAGRPNRSHLATAALRCEFTSWAAPVLRATCADTRNAARLTVPLCPMACPTGPEFPMAKPNQAGIIIRVSGVGVPPPALRQAPQQRGLSLSRAVCSPRLGGPRRACSDRNEALRSTQIRAFMSNRVSNERVQRGGCEPAKSILGETWPARQEGARVAVPPDEDRRGYVRPQERLQRRLRRGTLPVRTLLSLQASEPNDRQAGTVEDQQGPQRDPDLARRRREGQARSGRCQATFEGWVPHDPVFAAVRGLGAGTATGCLGGCA